MSALNTYITTFNCARVEVQPSDFASALFTALPNQQAPEILILCLQEVAPLAYCFIGGSPLLPYLAKFKTAVDIAATALGGASYVNIINRNVGLTAIMVFVRRGETERVKWIKTAEVGVGLWEMGNKGAVGVRIGLETGDETAELTFVSAHLAPMEWNCERRNEDWKSIVRRLVFEPVSRNPLSKGQHHRLYKTADTTPLLSSSSDGGTDSTSSAKALLAPTTHLIFAGDLNYRTASTGPNQIDQSHFPQPCEDESFPRHYWHLLSSDQLSAEMRKGRTCHGLKEAPIDFPPTYKYSTLARQELKTGKMKAEDMDDETKGGRWEWATHRWPSWCDRVLYLDAPAWARDNAVEVISYKALPLLSSSDHRPVVCALSIPVHPIPEPTSAEREKDGGVRCSPPFTIDPYWKQRRKVARALEVVVGLGAYMTTTREAWVLLPLLILLLVFLATGFSRGDLPKVNLL